MQQIIFLNKYYLLGYLFISFPMYSIPKIVVLVPGRNESNILAQFFQAAVCIADAIVYLDDASTDNSLEIARSLAQACRIESIIEKKQWYRDEPGDRNRLLQEGRRIGGTHFVVLDVDEMFTANLLRDNFLKNKILSLRPGDVLKFAWIMLWRSVDYYRFDSSVWTNNYKDFIFCDDQRCSYQSNFIHTPRTPSNLRGRSEAVAGYQYGVLHFQFVNWENLLIKQSWYRCLERIRDPKKSIASINQLYKPSKDETNLHCERSNPEWFKYSFFDATAYMKQEGWRKKQILEWFQQYGISYFVNLDIWDIDWGIDK